MTLLERRRALMMQIKRKSKNLFDISKVVTSNRVINNGDGTLTVNTYGANIGYLKNLCPELKVGDIVVLSFETDSNIKYFYISGDVKKNWNQNKATTITQEVLDATILVYCKRVDGVNSPALLSNIQIELGTEATEYEPYY